MALLLISLCDFKIISGYYPCRAEQQTSLMMMSLASSLNLGIVSDRTFFVNERYLRWYISIRMKSSCVTQCDDCYLRGRLEPELSRSWHLSGKELSLLHCFPSVLSNDF